MTASTARDAAGGPAGFLAPAYRDRSLADVIPAVARALGAGAAFEEEPSPGLVLPEAEAYVVFLVDGLGHEQLVAHADTASFLAEHLGGSVPGTAGVPSTTATSLTSLGTALTPGQHGVVGYTSRIPGTDELLNALSWSKEVDPVQWQPLPTAFERLAAAGVHASTVTKREFVRSGLTQVSSRGAHFVGSDRLGERLVAVGQTSAHRPSLTYVYDGDLDWTGHRYGVASAQWDAQLAVVDMAVEQLRESLPDEVRIVVTADHGMVDASDASRIDVAHDAELRAGMSLLGGDARLRHVYCRAGAVADLSATWAERLGERAEVLARDEAIERGWFGSVRSEVLPRLGDVVVACRDDHVVVDTAAFPYEATLIGMHGSLTPAEMLIPMVVL